MTDDTRSPQAIYNAQVNARLNALEERVEGVVSVRRQQRSYVEIVDYLRRARVSFPEDYVHVPSMLRWLDEEGGS